MIDHKECHELITFDALDSRYLNEFNFLEFKKHYHHIYENNMILMIYSNRYQDNLLEPLSFQDMIQYLIEIHANIINTKYYCITYFTPSKKIHGFIMYKDESTFVNILNSYYTNDETIKIDKFKLKLNNG